MYMKSDISTAVDAVKGAEHLSCFTGAGISVESGISPFRGENGLWNTYDPALFEIDYYLQHPAESWPLMIRLFYETFEKARPNRAHEVIAALEQKSIFAGLITQNIDNLHFRAGSRKLVEYHGNSRQLICTVCGRCYQVSRELFDAPVPRCSCSGLLKPDFVFFGEDIPPNAVAESERIASETDVMLVIGTTGLVYPAALIPWTAKTRGTLIIEVNTTPSEYTDSITDIYLQGRAADIMNTIWQGQSQDRRMGG
jgi:NAD-dependent deacetylase